MPKAINKIPDRTDQILLGKLPKPYNFCPNQVPTCKKKNWKLLTNKGNAIELICMKLPPIPMQKLSKERAKARKIASFESIEWDLSKSE